MIIVLPVCAKDESLALLNLEWCLKMEGKTAFECLVASEVGYDDSKVVDLARQYFEKVSQMDYPRWTGSEEWPSPQNWAWQSVARRMPYYKRPWFWWEADAVPMHSGWLTAIDEAYIAGKKPFMGVWARRDGPGNVSGVAVYPADVGRFCPDALRTQNAAPIWNRDRKQWLSPKVLSWDEILGPRIRDQCHDVPSLFLHVTPATFESIEEVHRRIPDSCLVFHKCKDGSLQEVLLGRRKALPQEVKGSLLGNIAKMFYKSQVVDNGITVVITNWKRPDKLREAFQSCLDAKVSRVIISASAVDPELARVHESIKRVCSNVVIDAIEEDRGNNEMWLRGVRLATTPWVHILHDDDKLLPRFEKLTPGAQDVGFYYWPGERHGVATGGVYDALTSYQSGVYSTEILWKALISPTSFTISPVGGLFRKEHLVEVLEECEANLVDDRFFYRPTLMVGNDLLIWLRAVEKYPRFCYLKPAHISYGHWDGSCSYEDSKRGHKRLKEIYSATRDYFLRGPRINGEPPVFLHAYSDFEDSDRVHFAHREWLKQYGQAKWFPCPIPDACLPRLFDDGFRKVPYVKDLINYAFEQGDKSRFLVFSNSDVIPCASLSRHLAAAMAKYPCCYSYRRDIEQPALLTEEDIRLKTSVFSGLDLFCFTYAWWTKNQESLPDLLYAAESWDYCLQKLMDKTGGKGFLYLIYHVNHPAELVRNKDSKSRAYNKKVAAEFLKSNGITPYWEINPPPNLNPR